MHAEVAASTARRLRLPANVVAEGEAIAAEISRLTGAGGGWPDAFAAVSRSLSTWYDRIKTGVPLELRLRASRR